MFNTSAYRELQAELRANPMSETDVQLWCAANGIPTPRQVRTARIITAIAVAASSALVGCMWMAGA